MTDGGAPVAGPGERWSRGARVSARRARRLLTDLVVGPEHRRLRYVLLAGFAIRFLLAPLTAWAGDTTYFTWSGMSLLERGDPYFANTLFNPPLGPLSEAPGLAVLSLVVPVEHFVQFYPALLGPAESTGVIYPYLPTPAALLALKLPLILADGAVALLVYRLLRAVGEGRWATAGAAAWFLNPVVIWASSVHGEVDVLAALAVVGFLWAMRAGSSVGAGIALGLGGFAKLYPLALLPLAAAVLWRTHGTAPVRRVALGLSAGLLLSAVPFLPYLSGLAVVLAHQAGNNNYGGLTVLILFNPQLSPLTRSWPAGLGHLLADAYEASLVLAILGGIAYVWRRPADVDPADPRSVATLSVLTLGVVAGSLLALLSAQAENVVGLLPPLLLALPALKRAGRGLFAAVTSLTWLQYLTLGGPLAFFYPLALLLGPSAVGTVSTATVDYATKGGLLSQGPLWVLFGAAGGAAVLATWLLFAVWLERELRPVPGWRAALRRAAARVRPPDAAPGRPAVRSDATSRAGRGAAVSGLLVGTTLLLAATAGSITVTTLPPPLAASLGPVSSSPNGGSVVVGLTGGAEAVEAHLALLPGRTDSPGPIEVFDDAAFPGPFATFTEIHQIGERLILALAAVPGAPSAQFVDAAELDALLASGSPATLVVLGGVLPVDALSNTSSALHDWIAGGGTLIWAGGPLGWAEGAGGIDGAPFHWSSLYWLGQIELLGYPLADPTPSPYLLATHPTPLGSALGIGYNGTPSGANVSEVAEHGGTVLGWETPAGPDGAAPRASLVTVPLGGGRIDYFGGSFAAATRPQQFVPAADPTLASDLEILALTGLVPGSGAPVDASATVAAGAHLTVTLRTAPDLGPAILLVTVPGAPVLLSAWVSPVTLSEPGRAPAPTPERRAGRRASGTRGGCAGGSWRR